MNVKALAQLAGKFAHAAIDAGDEDRNARIFMGRRAEKRCHQRQLVEFSLIIEPCLMLPTVPQRVHGENVVAHFRHRLFPLNAEAPLVVPFDLGTETENKSAMGKARQIPSDLRRNRRTAREGHGDARAQTQTLAMLRRQHQRQKRLMGSFKGPDAVESQLIGKARQRRHLAEIVNQ